MRNSIKPIPVWVLIVIVFMLIFFVLFFTSCYWPYYQHREFDPITKKLRQEETLGIFSFGVNHERSNIRGQTANVRLEVGQVNVAIDPNLVEAIAEAVLNRIVPVLKENRIIAVEENTYDNHKP